MRDVDVIEKIRDVVGELNVLLSEAFESLREPGRDELAETLERALAAAMSLEDLVEVLAAGEDGL